LADDRTILMSALSRYVFLVLYLKLVAYLSTTHAVHCVQHICKKSGWKENSKQWTHCRELFVELWRNLQHTADNDDDGQITVDEWVSIYSQR